MNRYAITYYICCEELKEQIPSPSINLYPSIDYNYIVEELKNLYIYNHFMI